MLTPHEDAIRTLREQGLTHRAIAARLNMSTSRVRRTLARLGVTVPTAYDLEAPRNQKRAASHRRRLERALGELHGIAASLGQLNMRWALSEMSWDDKHELEAQLRRDFAALRRTLGQLKEARDSNGSGP